jgi:glycosyltransferase involved in cell wall biosynthesis
MEKFCKINIVKNFTNAKKYLVKVERDKSGNEKLFQKEVLENLRVEILNKKIDSLNKNVEFFSKLSNQEVRTFYNQALFIVIPNIKLQNESSGLSCCLQAMACGKAVIIADAPPLRDLFEDGKHCLFYDPENSVDLKNKIEFLLNNRQIREELAKNGYGLVCKNFTCKQMGVVLESVLSST